MMDTQQIIQAQYQAALTMLEQAVQRCPAALWNDAGDKSTFWHIAYHALFYTHLYLQTSAEAFQPWVHHRPDYEMMGPPPWDPTHQPAIGEPYTPADILAYLAFCRHEVARCLPSFALSAPSGFPWLPFTKLELQIYSIRHLQQHTGELMERLGTRAGIEIDWIGSGQP